MHKALCFEVFDLSAWKFFWCPDMWSGNRKEFARWLTGKESTCNAGDLDLIPGSGRFPGKGNGNHSSILAWRIPQTEEAGELQSMGSPRVGHWLKRLSTRTCSTTFRHFASGFLHKRISQTDERLSLKELVHSCVSLPPPLNSLEEKNLWNKWLYYIGTRKSRASQVAQW